MQVTKIAFGVQNHLYILISKVLVNEEAPCRLLDSR